MSSATTSRPWKHDVFASFRGPDTRKKFMSHLFKRLEQENISYFHDQDTENTGKEIKVIFGAIRHAKIALVVFSENYADSRWCLNELVEILNCKKDRNLLVIPIFLIRVSEVKEWANGSKFEEALEYLHVKEWATPDEFKQARDNQQKEWENALKEALKLIGFSLVDGCTGNEAELMDKIVEGLVMEIRKIRPLYFLKDIIPVDHFADHVISLLNKGGKKGVRMVGICGPEGIGKTTVAGVAFDRIRHEFEPSHFVAKIGEESESGRPNDLLKEFLKKLGGEECSNVIGALTDKIKGRMHGKKILLVLDGVTDEKQVEEFGVGKRTNRGKMEIGDGSRILITTRDRDLLTSLRVDDKYIVNGLNQDKALQLLRRDAFKTEGREPGHEELSEKLTHYAGGHPLLLRALGSYVRDEPPDHWSTTLDKLVRSASSRFLRLQSVGLNEGQAGGAVAHGHATDAGVRQSSVRIVPVINPSTIDCSIDRCLLRSFEHGELPHGKIVLVELDFPNESPIASIEDIKLSCRAYPFEVVGPFGVVDGKHPWKDEGYTDVREIVVYVGSNPKAIRSIFIIYDKNGRPSDHVPDDLVGKNYEAHAVKLNYPNEYLTSISGHIGKDSGLTTLRSLTIITNVARYGPYGTTEGKEFSFPYTGGKIVGFHGSYNDSDHLESIGAFYKPIPHTYPVKIVEPFGSDGGISWDLDNIKRIHVHHADFIIFPCLKVNQEANYGGNCGQNTFEVELKNGEYITSFAGYFQNGNGSGTGIKSLTFQTNKRILGPIGTENGLGPIGTEKGVYFSLPSEAGKVTRLFGRRSDDCITSIGAKVEPYYPFESVGPFGWEHGSKWDDGNQHNNVKSIVVELYSRGEDTFIRSIKLEYEEKNKKLPQLKKHGGVEIKLDRDEYLNSISGYMFQRSKETFGLTSLTFQTNKKMLKPIGVEKGKHFSAPTTGGKIVGFYGWSGEHLNALGAHFQPISHLYPVKSIGPFGGTSGNDWDDGKFDGVKKISAMLSPDIHYIKFVYDKSGREVSVEHGCNTTGAFAELKEFSLYQGEYLTSISGYKQEDGAIIQSLRFYTNKRISDSFGEEKGKYFWYPSTGSRIIGFYGRSGDKLNAIGVYAEPVPHMYRFETIEPFGGSGGAPWDDGVHSDVRGFLISCGDAVHSIQIVYDNNGSAVYGSVHGGGDGPEPQPLWLDYPKERLISISAYMDASGNTSPIRTLEIFTTNGRRGLFLSNSSSKLGDLGKNRVALKKLKRFTIPPALDGGRIVGFFGRAGSHLNSIGAHLE